ncbi:2-methylcitrate dehydratase PrpD [Roseovarius litoreus]|uniref:2-methylcitrate dehydratase PrpD n=1 Tax=Roseovarius litoreus TaxID=1155722 RepID=A0A1M7GVM4_9RHOB|nr:MmgE/PrpD family protein [Roseovarius litoreus]SHM19889.1 2-methylcitrate dehydratase PrpD [Roseovarius litoreus]
MSLTDRLAQFALTDPRHLPESAKRIMALSLIDWMGCAIAGRDEAVSHVVRRLAQDEGGTPQAHLVGGGQAPARMAALVNGTISHALDYDDTHFAHIGHPSVAVVPSALAIAERCDADGAALQDAALIGAELSVRVGLWLGRGHYETGFHQTATAGAFGAAAAAGRLLGFDADQMAATLGLVATRASGLKAQFGTMGKPFNAGIAASNGVEAALLVANGLVPNPAALKDFGASHAGSNMSDALEDIGNKWTFEDVSHKFHACCHGLHAALEAFAEVAPERQDIAAITVHTHPRWLSVCNQPDPQTGLGCKFSFRAVLAMAMAGHDTSRLETFSDGFAQAPELVALRDRVKVVGDESVSETGTHLVLRMNDGSEKRVAHDLLAPMTVETRRAKIMAKGTALMGSARAERVARLVEGRDAPSSLARELAD